MYSFEFDDKHALLYIKLTGFWGREDLASYSSELMDTFTRIRRKHETIKILSNCIELAIQSEEIAQGFQNIMSAVQAQHNDPCAIVLGGMLAKMQAERVLASVSFRIFLDENEAREWLLSYEPL